MLKAAKRSCVFSACYEFIHCKCNDTKAITKALIDWFKASRACPHPWEGLRYFLVKHCYLDILGLLLINHPLLQTPTNALSEGNVSVRKTWKGTNITISTLIHGPSTPAANIEVLPASDASAWQAAVSEPPKGLLFCSEFRVWKVHLKLRSVTRATPLSNIHKTPNSNLVIPCVIDNIIDKLTTTLTNRLPSKVTLQVAISDFRIAHALNLHKHPHNCLPLRDDYHDQCFMSLHLRKGCNADIDTERGLPR